jgi:apolipoprotein N-acyltransferase
MEVSTMERLFGWSSLAVMPCWALMILLPRARVTERLMRTPVAPALLALLYAVLVLPRMGALLPMLARPELAPVAALLGTPEGATIGWVHFLAFDLFVGRWAYLDARERGVSPWLMAPVLLLILMFGPLGLLAYLGLRALSTRAAAAAEVRS